MKYSLSGYLLGHKGTILLDIFDGAIFFMLKNEMVCIECELVYGIPTYIEKVKLFAVEFALAVCEKGAITDSDSWSVS